MKNRIVEETDHSGKSTYFPEHRFMFIWFRYPICVRGSLYTSYPKEFDFYVDAYTWLRQRSHTTTRKIHKIHKF
jgi:hypothetical protein